VALTLPHRGADIAMRLAYALAIVEQLDQSELAERAVITTFEVTTSACSSGLVSGDV
jgi:hypothetical protein